MIVGTGIDLVRIDRIASAMQRWPDRFVKRVFSARERAECGERAFPHIHFSGRFAVKEALMKALGTGWSRGIRWTEIECLAERSGRPKIVAHGAVRKTLDARRVQSIHVSISHDGDYAIAHVVLEGGPARPGSKR
jgi:holo-[acyl-carrier protein] synthase